MQHSRQHDPDKLKQRLATITDTLGWSTTEKVKFLLKYSELPNELFKKAIIRLERKTNG